MRKLIIGFVLFCLPLIFGYMVGAFVAHDFNIKNWSILGTVWLIFISIGCSIITVGLVKDFKK